MMRKIRPVIFSALLSGATLCFALPVLADQHSLKNTSTQEQQSPAYSLPGVKPAKPIVTPPQAEPDEEHLRANPDGSFMVGKTRVKISGSVIVDVGTSSASQK